ncbi:MAG: guanylate kinase [Paludibacteraceae bacterium]|nr:guanylate kinase [Paludibacteraceae bacterium]
MSKLIIFSAPSGSGKSTIIGKLLEQNLGMEFSISATSRPPRGSEQDGVEYYFLSADEFKAKIASGEFVEYEEVYKDRFYGTLKSEIQRIGAKGNATVFDVDVKGGLNIKKQYGADALTIFIMPPSIEELRRRLEGRGTDAQDVIEQRLKKAEYEISFAPQFDKVIVNDNLQKATEEAGRVVRSFLDR